MQKQQRFRAYLWFAYILIMLCGGHYLFYYFAFHYLNPIAVTRGLMVGAVLWSTVLYIAMLRHHGWARYALAIMMVLTMLAMGWAAMIMNTRSVQSIPGPTKAAVGGIVLYSLSLIPLGVSRSVRRYLAPLTAGGRWS